MKAAILHAPGTPLVIEELDISDVQPAEVRIRTVASGLCHSDYHYMTGSRHCMLPALLGHEVSGIVEAVGAAVPHLRPGDRVVASVPSCGMCGECLGGHAQRCNHRPTRTGPPRLSVRGQPVLQFVEVGGFAETVLADHRGVVRVPEDVPLDLAAMFGCAVLSGFGAVACCARVPTGATVAVIGCGGVGLNIIQAARIAGASRIVAIDPVASKRALGARLGATDVLPSGAEVAAQVLDITNGGVDYAFEVVGSSATIAQSLAMLGKGGAAILVGIPPAGTEAPLPLDLMFRKELRVLSTISGSTSLASAMPRLAQYYRDGALLLDPLVDRRIRLADINDGFEAMRCGAATRVMIDFSLPHPPPP